MTLPNQTNNINVTAVSILFSFGVSKGKIRELMGHWFQIRRGGRDRGSRTAKEGYMNPETLITICCNKWDKPLSELLTPCRKKEYIIPRACIMYFLYKYTGISLCDIGRIFNRDHSTVIHALQAVENDLYTNNNLKKIYESIENKIKEYDKTPPLAGRGSAKLEK